MKKILCMLFALILALTTAVPAFASPDYSDADSEGVHYGIHQLNPKDFVAAPSIAPFGTRAGTLNFTFSGGKRNSVYTDFVEYYFSAGSSAVLYVANCGWEPAESPLEIGIYNWSTAENWYYIRRDGSYSGYLNFPSLSAGRYSAYVRSLGTDIEYGAIRYSLS